jgi:hypothetical protein
MTKPGATAGHAFCKDPTQVTTEAAAMLRWRQRSSKDSCGDGDRNGFFWGKMWGLDQKWLVI